MGPSPSLWFLHAKQRLLEQNYKSLWVPDLICRFGCKTATFRAELQVSMGPRPHLSFCACTTAYLASELLVSMGPSPDLRFIEIENDFRTRIACLYGAQTSPEILRMQNSVPSIRITSLYASQPSSVVLWIQRATLGSELHVSMGPSPHLWFCAIK